MLEESAFCRRQWEFQPALSVLQGSGAEEPVGNREEMFEGRRQKVLFYCRTPSCPWHLPGLISKQEFWAHASQNGTFVPQLECSSGVSLLF